MSTQEEAGLAGRAPKHAARVDDAAAPEGAAEPSWWHRSHPTFVRLAGFFTGLVVVIVVPLAFAAVLSQVVGDDRVARFLPYGLLLLLVPLGLAAVPRTRRFGLFMLVGMVATAVVAAAAAGLTVWYLYSHD